MSKGSRPTRSGVKSQYNPNLGHIGKSEVEVANYLLGSKKHGAVPIHAKGVATTLMSRDVQENHTKSKKLTKFLAHKDMTFSKKTEQGHKIFSVPCTTSMVPLPKSLFNEIEKSAQVLAVSLRKVLQDIYSQENLEDSAFIQSLPDFAKRIFIEAIESSPNYFKQLHHPSMKDYPFFDNVGLDLVLVDDFLKAHKNIPGYLKTGRFDELKELPFRILELNAGSPSGASNNMNILQGLGQEDPQILKSLGKVMPNDHFETLHETYSSLGREWTGQRDAVQVILPPGGKNGASPEIHQLAAYSGLVYADPVQLYSTEDGHIRLRTATGHDPIVNAIYSRVNSDSALFDPSSDILLRDPETGEPLHMTDPITRGKGGKDGKGLCITDQDGRPKIQKSGHAIPGLLKAIHSRKIYMGGLNRILDNKIILSTLSYYAPKFYEGELKRLGISTKSTLEIAPPKTLPPRKSSVEEIAKNPDRWVIKAANLAGGQGVFILKTLSDAKKRSVIKMAMKDPESYAYQELVKIGRIPVAVGQSSKSRYANLAADLRMWIFFGGGKNTLPKLTHNALVRYAPHEKGPMSSIVNTSMGGGYAPFAVVDDTNDPSAIPGEELGVLAELPPLKCDLPAFVSAQVVQVARLVSLMMAQVEEGRGEAASLTKMALALKTQCREVLSFIDPLCMEDVYSILGSLDKKVKKKSIETYEFTLASHRLSLTTALNKLEKLISSLPVKNALDSLKSLNESLDSSIPPHFILDHDLNVLEKFQASPYYKKAIRNEEVKKALAKTLKIVRKCVQLERPYSELGPLAAKQVLERLNRFNSRARTRLEKSDQLQSFCNLFTKKSHARSRLRFETLYLGHHDENLPSRTASQIEYQTGVLLTETHFIPAHLREAREAWLKILDQASSLGPKREQEFIERRRKLHFKKFPFLQNYQKLVSGPNDKGLSAMLEVLDILPYAKINLEKFAELQGLELKEIFGTELGRDRIAILNAQQRKDHGINDAYFAGECYAQKENQHHLYSESDIFTWISSDLDAFTQMYTAGHEIIHYHQIKRSMEQERLAISKGPLPFAESLNFYGNFLGVAARAIESNNIHGAIHRRECHGLDHFFEESNNLPRESTLLNEFVKSAMGGNKTWDQTLNKYGSALGRAVPNSPQERVKALREVLPALENGKNILFAKQLGLIIPYDEVASVLPTANEDQREEAKKLILSLLTSPDIDWEGLRAVANHQCYGVYFPKSRRPEHNLTIWPGPESISMGVSYNQTQQ